MDRKQLEEQLKAAQEAEALEIMNEIKAVLEKHGNRYALAGNPQFKLAGNGAWIVVVDVGLAPLA